MHCTFGNGLAQVMNLSRKWVRVRRLNELVSLITVFEELSHVMSPFWSRDIVSRGITLLHKLKKFKRIKFSYKEI